MPRRLEAARSMRKLCQWIEVPQPFDVLGCRGALARVLTYDNDVSALAAAKSQFKRATQAGRTALPVPEVALQSVARCLPDGPQYFGLALRRREGDRTLVRGIQGHRGALGGSGIRTPLDVAVRRDDPQSVWKRIDERAHLRHALGERPRGGGVAQDVLDPTGQQRPIDGLGDEVGCSGLEGEVDGGRVLVAGNHYDRDQGQ